MLETWLNFWDSVRGVKDYYANEILAPFRSAKSFSKQLPMPESRPSFYVGKPPDPRSRFARKRDLQLDLYKYDIEIRRKGTFNYFERSEPGGLGACPHRKGQSEKVMRGGGGSSRL